MLGPMSALAGVFDDLEVHGFATQGFVKTSANRFFGDSEDGSFDFTELGVNATFEPLPSLRMSGQLLSRRAGDMSSGSPSVDFALMDYSIFSSTDAKVNILAGRVKNPLGLFNDTRDVAFTRPGIFLPQTIYVQSVRSLALSADGLALVANQFLDAGSVNMQIGIGRPLIDENVEYAYLGRGFRGDYESDGLSWIGRIMYETSDQRWRFAFSGASTSLSFRPEPGDHISEGETSILYMIASGQYVSEDWTLSSECVLEPTNYNGFPGTPYAGQDPTFLGYYAQLSFHLRHDIDLMVRYEEGYIDKSDRDGHQFERETGLPAHSRYLKATSVGLRWNLAQNFMLSAEYQRNNGTLILSNRENPDPFQTKKNWDLFSFSASYRF